MLDPHTGRPGRAEWSVGEIPYGSIERTAVRDEIQLFYVVASASFVEITSDLYTRNLVELFRHDEEIADWLANYWEPEEVQHGMALKRYVETAWPDFDWRAAYRDFYAEYSQYCLGERLDSVRALEMVARCVVETGTASFYRMLSDLSPEPVLHDLAARIAADEVRHYKHFYSYFRRYREREHPSRVAVFRKLWQKIDEVDAEDAYFSFKHVFLSRNPGAEFTKNDYDRFRRGVRGLGKAYFPYGMAVKMLLKPLDLNTKIEKVAVPTMAAATRLLLLR